MRCAYPPYALPRVKRAWSGLLVALPLPAMALGDYPMTYLRSYGPAADPITWLGWGLLGISVAVVIIISVLLLWGIFRRRPEVERDEAGMAPVTHGKPGLSWITIGVSISSVVLLASTVWIFVTFAMVARPPGQPRLELRVTAHQWWWEVTYLNENPRRSFTTANEIHIPVGVPVRIQLRTADVIHSFWVPQLAGKTDILPGRTNVMWMQADKAGIYRGQCGEYCGAQHAHMAMHVIARPPDEFKAWYDHQLEPAEPPEAPLALRGKRVFLGQCAVCHTVRGTRANGIVGPDLTHLMSRGWIGAGLLVNNPGNLAGWVSNAQAFKPGARMPRMTLTSEELQAVLAYLKTLD